ncbi:MAG: HutP family protein [Candidatus Riflebacteria bacterium]|mgnify:FL=1|jgi:hypothetical protein|nr:HutP [Candidatus Riflebacteria bacterium]MDD2623294.1 HutP family protein [Candidatus Riflebacteria bacterium]MDD3376239.1 HutP family protein [Candidatus Riflebacteria bacterium]NCB45518.1 HutP [bacterium]NLV93475.1 HutP [Candidatus Riflebacteria bacterium]
MTKPAFEDVLLLNGAASLGKAAVLCSMIDNEHDDEIVVFLAKYGIKSVITRAGGNGENLKNKILRNTFGAAENSGIMAVTPKNRHAVVTLVEEILRSLEGPLINVSGGGLKIGLAVHDKDLAMSVFGTVGLPGLNIDREVSATRVLHHCLEN